MTGCVLCNRGELENVKHFLDRCEEFSLEGQDDKEEHKSG